MAARSAYERSDVTAVPACGVIAEAMLAFVLADALLEVTGGDRLDDVRQTRSRRTAPASASLSGLTPPRRTSLPADLNPAVLRKGAPHDPAEVADATLGARALLVAGLRLAAAHRLPEEQIDGAFPARVGLRRQVERLRHVVPRITLG